MLAAAHIPTRPELTLPAAEAACLRAAYENADVILEYGSGGSTVMASEMADKSVVSVESDKNWADMMCAWFAANPGLSTPKMHYADIGPTGQWGMPEGNKRWRAWPKYPLEIWKSESFRQPDVVLIDGRFRIGCLLATLFSTQKRVDVFFDDYAGRDPYHAVERFVKPAEIIGRMARFEIQPTQLIGDQLLDVIQMMTRPR